MGLFSKKYDIEKSPLRIEFDYETLSYVTYYGFEFIPYNQLNRRSKKKLDEKNRLLIENPQIMEQETELAKTKIRCDKLQSLGYPCHSFEYLGIADGTMSKQMETLLNGLMNEENVLLGIHRIGSDDSPKKIGDILTNGLVMTGHFGGVVLGSKVLENNVSYYPDNKTIIKELMYANVYKNSKGSILIRIPDDDLKGDILYVDKNGDTRLLPKYIVGYVPLEENHHLEKIITSQSYSRKELPNSFKYDPNNPIPNYLESREEEQESVGKVK